ncbi:MAG: hypothetical protein Q8S46_01125 [Methylotenera sp.]|nr:hypothetical protein [Methylotenera sp.]MDP1958317.1 hypothetical protein [Methylotenera sp.]MDP3206958.1 hypothetical protein [Methylotenera sp.]MDP3302742.1 hypothetical protein [Methylotenera sp.]MDP3944134.1 hypothetical protein [Methylotenera sp.]
MNRDMYKYKMHTTIPAALFIAIEGLYAAPLMAGDGIVVLQRDVPVRHAIREGSPGRAISIDVSPDDKVKKAVSGQQASLKSMEIGDSEFANISTDTPQGLSVVTNATNAMGLSNVTLGGHGLNSTGGGSVQSLGSTLSGTVGGAVGGATGQMAGGIAGATGALGGLAGAIMRTSGQ